MPPPAGQRSRALCSLIRAPVPRCNRRAPSLLLQAEAVAQLGLVRQHPAASPGDRESVPPAIGPEAFPGRLPCVPGFPRYCLNRQPTRSIPREQGPE